MSFWGNAARIGLAAAPFVAAPFTGGASLALIGAGAGAGSALLGGGGAKDALLAGGMGAAHAMPGGAPLAQSGPSAASPGIWSKILDVAKRPEVMQAGAGAIAAATQGAASNRSARLDREGETLRRLQMASHIANDEGYQNPSGLPSFGIAPKAPTQQVRESASELEKELMKRLQRSQGADRPGIFERIGTYAAPAMAMYGSGLFGQQGGGDVNATIDRQMRGY